MPRARTSGCFNTLVLPLQWKGSPCTGSKIIAGVWGGGGGGGSDWFTYLVASTPSNTEGNDQWML